MATPQIVLDITDAGELVRFHGINNGRKTVIARLEPVGSPHTIYWENEELRSAYHKSVAAYLTNEKIVVHTQLMKGQKPDVIPANATLRPVLHKLQGDLTPGNLDWLHKYAPVEFQNTLGVELRELKPGEKPPLDPRDLWVRMDVIRTDSRPKPGTHGGEYVSTRFKMRQQIIARRASHLTFTRKEILVEERDVDGNLVEATTPPPYEDRFSPDLIDKMEKKGDIEVVWKRAAAASAGSNF